MLRFSTRTLCIPSQAPRLQFADYECVYGYGLDVRLFPAPGCGIAIETKNIGVGGRRGFDCGSRRTANLGGDRLIRTPIIILEG